MNPQDKFDASQFDILESWMESDVESKSIDDREMADILEICKALQKSADSFSMPDSNRFRAHLMKKVRPGRLKKILGTGLALAAAVLLAILLQPNVKTPAPDGPQIVLDEGLLKHAIQNQAKQSMLAYLQDTEHLLLAMRDFDVHCSDDQLDLKAEKQRAQHLLMQQKLFSTQMSHPQYLQAKQLFEQLERILVDVNSMEVCSDQTEVDFINRHINDNRILSKLRLVAQEFQVS